MAFQIFSLINIVKVDYVGGTNPIYYGVAIPGSLTSDAAWKIARVDYDVNSNPIQILFAKGNLDHNKVWDDRATYTYA